ncbi:MAG: cation-translocating P-type ATPase [Candidatus Binatia bacterium]
MSARVALSRLGSGERGLTEAEAARRLDAFGPNAMPDLEQRSRWRMLLDQVTNLPSGLLVCSSGISAAIGDRLDAGAILAAVGLNAAIGYRIERHSADLLGAWRRLEAGAVPVVRGGALRSVPATVLVPGDVVLCRAGDRVPADLRVLESHRLHTEEAALTGESESQAKSADTVAKDTTLALRSAMLFAGTTIVSGHGRALVTATGSATELARVRALIERHPPPATPLQRQLDQLGAVVAAAGLGAGAVTATIGALRGRPIGAVLRSGIALAVAAIPEGLPVVATAALVRAMQRMRANGIVVRRLAAAEALGGVSVVCADKTGTLTCNDMRLEVLEFADGGIDPATVRAEPARLFQHPPTLALAAAVLNSDVDVQRHEGKTTIAGSSTERALVSAAEAAGLERAALRQRFPRRELRERDGGVRYVISLHRAPMGGDLAFVKGAPEQVLRLCSADARGRPLTAATRRRLLARNHALADEGLRVLALGWRRVIRGQEPRRDFRLIGLAGLRDPLREGAAAVVESAARAGLRTLILTGDQHRTAAAVARLVGLPGAVRDGAQVARLVGGNGRRASAALDQLAAAARVTPEQKLAIVRALRAQGVIVAMTGDGMNDAPALKAADVGVAVGADASDLAREAADVVLASGDLRGIVAAVGEGRVVQDNLRRAVRFVLATNLAEVMLAICAALAGTREPFSPVQLLWLNLLSDTLPAVALTREQASGDVLGRPPAPPNAPLVDAHGRRAVVRDGLALAGLGMLSHLTGGPQLVFSTLGGAELGYALACRPSNEPVDPSFGRWLGAAAVLHLGALTFPPLRGLLGLHGGVRALELAGFAVGAVLPWAAVRFTADDRIVRPGRDLRRRQPAGAAAGQRVPRSARAARRSVHVHGRVPPSAPHAIPARAKDARRSKAKEVTR